LIDRPPSRPRTAQENRDRTPWTRRDLLLVVALLLLAGGLRFVRLADPNSLVFDETYYAKDACLYLGLGQDFCGTPAATEQSYVHPPLGKWLIAAGIKTFGYNSFGWRVSGAFVGTLLVLLVYLLARKLFRDRWVAGAAGFLAATDFLLIVQSRTSMLDIFVSFFVVIGFLFLAFDRDRVLLLKEHVRLPYPGNPPRREPEWRVLAGAALGLAVATKWSGIWALVAGVILAAVWSASLSVAYREAPGPGRGLPLGEFGLTVLSFAIVPVAVYLLSYVHFFADVGFSPSEFGKLQKSMFDFHANLTAEHSYQSRAVTWPLVIRPIAYFYEGEPQATHILAFGNPVTWWAALGAGIWLVVRSLKRWAPERLVLAGWLIQYLPWVVLTDPLIARFADEIATFGYLLVVIPIVVVGFFRNLRRFSSWSRGAVAAYAGFLFLALVAAPAAIAAVAPSIGRARAAIFFFYMTPIVPFMLIGLAAAIGALREAGFGLGADFARAVRALTLVYLVAIALLTAFFYPVIAAVGLPPEAWKDRMWFQSWI
jgi:dolichyl-phosphate-mannose-protein mannosyltransferase